MLTSDFTIDQDAILSELISQLSLHPHVAKSFRSSPDFDYACSVINKRYQYLLQLKEKLHTTEAVIEHVEAMKIRNSNQMINFPTNSIHPLTLVSPLVQTQFNGLVPLPTRVDLLTGANEIHPDYSGEPVLECELMTVEDIPLVSRVPDVPPLKFDLKRMRIKE